MTYLLVSIFYDIQNIFRGQCLIQHRLKCRGFQHKKDTCGS